MSTLCYPPASTPLKSLSHSSNLLISCCVRALNAPVTAAMPSEKPPGATWWLFAVMSCVHLPLCQYFVRIILVRFHHMSMFCHHRACLLLPLMPLSRWLSSDPSTGAEELDDLPSSLLRRPAVTTAAEAAAFSCASSASSRAAYLLSLEYVKWSPAHTTNLVQCQVPSQLGLDTTAW